MLSSATELTTHSHPGLGFQAKSDICVRVHKPQCYGTGMVDMLDKVKVHDEKGGECLHAGTTSN